MAEYNGWKNYETWNVALYIGNDEGLYEMAKEYQGARDDCGNKAPYRAFAEAMVEMQQECQPAEDREGNPNATACTPDGIAWLDSGLDYPRLDEMIEEL